MKKAPFQPLAFSPWIAEEIAKSAYSIIITGGSGWLGQATLEMLEHCLQDDIHERVHVFGSHTRMLSLRSGRQLKCRVMTDIAKLPPQPCLIFHYAFITRGHAATMPLKEYIEQNEVLGNLIANEAQRLNATGLFIPSSGAVYRPDRSIDEDMEHNPYGAMKIRDERRFLGMAQQMRVAIMRIFNLAGPFINSLNYVLASILQDIQNGGPIRLRADKPVWRSYVHVRDVIDLAFSLLFAKEPSSATPFDTAAEVGIEMGELARKACILLKKPKLSIERPAIIGVPDRYLGDGATMATLMAKHKIIPRTLDIQILDTAQYLDATT